MREPIVSGPIKWIFIISAAILILGFIASLGGEGEEPTTTTEAKRVRERATTTEAPTTTTEKKQWTPVVYLSGNSLPAERQTVRSIDFELTTGEIRLVYTIEGGDALANMYIVKSDTRELDWPDVYATRASDTSYATKSPGQYYLVVQAANAKWNVRVEELR
ncbi:MAG: hypothetical protein KGZ93_02685 [Actinobacteria bacterium]|nr:hypothetical protein [Actinomycetota bacterium]